MQCSVISGEPSQVTARCKNQVSSLAEVMFGLLRHVCRRAPVLRPTLVAHYSSPPGEGWKEMTDALLEEGERQPAPPPRKAFAAPSRQPRRQQTLEKWKAFEPERVVRPHELTYKARVVAPRTHFSRRAAVGPPPNVARYADVFHQFGIDPLSQAQNPEMLAEFVSEMGKIYSRNITGLTTRSQRRIGKAIRRAKMMGVIPILSRPQSNYPYRYTKGR
ncbi:30S ribosomal protein S18, chloroplastic [Hypsizygus marmoreus]|uniref:Small ribosomal subunit protein bS18m n=1 Tax=Hypsizygus marmoreus TaxID=39966 RepID=A0A369JQ60_HYPMA|nr:30S ribosomal protein S18, chloroplastic [Hypsizygus marmoreus]